MDNSKPEPILCPECKTDLRATEKWKSGPVYHCVGGHSNTFGNWSHAPHHGRELYRCECEPSRILGCDRCVVRVDSVFCLRCGYTAAGDKLPDQETIPSRILTNLFNQYRGGKHDDSSTGSETGH